MTLAALENVLPPSIACGFLTNGPETTLPNGRALGVSSNINQTLVDDAVINLTLTPKTSISKTANYTLLATDPMDILVDATGGNVSLTLPTASTALEGKEYRAIKTDVSANTVGYTGTVLGASGTPTSTRYASLKVKCLQSAWYTV